MKRFELFIILFVFSFSTGCSIYMAASQPKKKDICALEGGGIGRDYVIAELGAPVSSTKKVDGTRIDIYEFYKGSSSGWKICRATFHTAADICTLALWEFVGTPTECFIKGDKITAQVVYDKEDMIKDFRILKGDSSRADTQ